MATKTRPALSLSPKEKKAVREFITMAGLAYGEKIQHAALFGSKVRGDDTKYSDVDILLIVAEEDRKFHRSIIQMAAEIELKYNILLDVRIIPTARWRYLAEIQSGLYKNISRDAVALRLHKRITPASGAG